MKKIFIFSLILIFSSVAASAQKLPQERFHRYHIEQRFTYRKFTPYQRMQLRNDRIRYNMALGRALRDGRIGPRERMRLALMRRHEMRQRFFFNYYNRRRVI